MLKDALKDFDIEREEIAFLLEPTMYNARSFKVRIPKLMPLIPYRVADIHEVYNTNIFCNDKPCRPGVAKRVMLQTYINIPRLGLSNLSTAGSWEDGNFVGIMPVGTRFLCNVISKNIREIYINSVMTGGR